MFPSSTRGIFLLQFLFFPFFFSIFGNRLKPCTATPPPQAGASIHTGVGNHRRKHCPFSPFFRFNSTFILNEHKKLIYSLVTSYCWPVESSLRQCYCTDDVVKTRYDTIYS